MPLHISWGWRDVPLARVAGGQVGGSGSGRKRCEYGGHCGVSDRGRRREYGTLSLSRWAPELARASCCNGRLFHGMDWSAGEIGYLLVPGISVQAEWSGVSRERSRVLSGAKVSGRSGKSSGAKSLRSFRKNWSPRKYLTMRPREMALAQTILNRSAQTLAYAIYNLAVALNCPLFVLGGSVGMHPAFWNATQEILEKGISVCNRNWYAVRWGLMRR